MSAVKTKKKKRLRKAIPCGKGLTFEKVWLLLQETDRIIKENAERFEQEKKESAERHKEIDRIFKESAERFEREKKENAERFEREKKESDERHKELDRITRRNSKQMGELHRRFGQLAEHLVAPCIAKRFNELGYHFDAISPKGQTINDSRGKVKTEIDLLLENGKTRILVEVKSRPVTQDIEHHIKRLELFSDKWRMFNEPKKVLGAIAGAIFEDDVKDAVREAGMYVIEQSGDTMKIDMPEGFIPREW